MQGVELGMNANSGEGAFALDDFLNMDGTEDAGMAFGDHFNF